MAARKKTTKKTGGRTTRRKRKKVTKKRSSKPSSPEESPAPAVQSITPEEAGTVFGPPTESPPSGREAFGSAAGEETRPRGAPAPALPEDPAAFVGLLETVFTMLLSTQAAALKVKEYPAELLSFTPAERAQLRLVAPMAAPYLPQVFARAPVIGAVLAAGMFGLFFSRRARDLKKLAKARREEAGPPKPGPVPMAPEDVPPPPTKPMRREGPQQTVLDVFPVPGPWPDGVPGPDKLVRGKFPPPFKAAG